MRMDLFLFITGTWCISSVSCAAEDPLSGHYEQNRQEHHDFSSIRAEISPLVDVRSFIPQIQVELKYATADNFTGHKVYNFQECLLLEETALRLRDIQLVEQPFLKTIK